MKLRHALAVFVLVVSFAAPVAAGLFEDAIAAYDKGDYATALQLFRTLSQQGNAAAQYNLGQMYFVGQGVPQDYAQAVKWYRKAAEHGDADAQYNLGVMYHEGQVVPQDDARAVEWSRKAAEQGMAKAQYNLGIAYAYGQGVPQDYVLAHMWSNLAASRGYKDGAKARNDLALRMTPAQIAEAQKMAREWKPKKER